EDVVTAFELTEEERGEHFAEPERRSDVDPRVLVDEAVEELAAVGALVEEDVGAIHVGRIVHHERAAFAADEVLRLVEAEWREATEAAERPPAITAEETVRVVLDELGTRPLVEDVDDAVDIARDARVVDRDNGADGVVHQLGEVRRVEAERLLLDVA